MAEIVTLAEAVAELVDDGQTVALEGFTHLIPHAAGHEIVRQGRRDLTLVRMTPDVVYDQLIGAGCARKLVFSWGGNPGVGSLHRFRDAVEHGWPVPLELEEHSHAGMAAAYAAGAANLPFGVLRGYRGTDLGGADAGRADRLPVHRRGARGGAGAPAGRRDRPRAAGRRARQRPALGDHRACRRRSCSPRRGRSSPSRRSSTSSSRGRARSCSRAGRSRPSRSRRGGAHPSYAHGYYDRDNAFYVAWDAISRDRDRFARLDAAARARDDVEGIAQPDRTGAVVSASRGRTYERLHARRDDGVAAARRLRDGAACFVGIGLPSRAANLARRRTRPAACSSTRAGRSARSPGTCRSRSATASWPRRRTRSSRCRRSSPTGSRRAGSTSASSAPRRSTASATSTAR